MFDFSTDPESSDQEAPRLRSRDFDFHLPSGLIAQAPAEPRDAARLMVLDRATGSIAHHLFSDLAQLLRPGDLLVANRSRVWPARLRGRREGSGGAVEALLLRRDTSGWQALVRPGRRLRPGARISFERDSHTLQVEVAEKLSDGVCRLHLVDGRDPDQLLSVGETPLPPYIQGWHGDPERYQTVYGDRSGSAAAPTAGLHFTPALLERLHSVGVEMDYLTLHVGEDTFRPIRSELVEGHKMHSEWAEVPSGLIRRARATRAAGGRVVAVGTTSVRALESAAAAGAGEQGWQGWTRLFIQPGFRFRLIDALITNFHLPRSSLILLVSAFAGRERIKVSYATAIEQRYRFFSFGDAMLIV